MHVRVRDAMHLPIALYFYLALESANTLRRGKIVQVRRPRAPTIIGQPAMAGKRPREAEPDADAIHKMFHGLGERERDSASRIDPVESLVYKTEQTLRAERQSCATEMGSSQFSAEGYRRAQLLEAEARLANDNVHDELLEGEPVRDPTERQQIIDMLLQEGDYADGTGLARREKHPELLPECVDTSNPTTDMFQLWDFTLSLDELRASPFVALTPAQLDSFNRADYSLACQVLRVMSHSASWRSKSVVGQDGIGQMRARGWELVANDVLIGGDTDEVPDLGVTYAFYTPWCAQPQHALLLAHRKGVIDFYQVVHALPRIATNGAVSGQGGPARETTDARGTRTPKGSRHASASVAPSDPGQPTLHTYFTGRGMQ